MESEGMPVNDEEEVINEAININALSRTITSTTIKLKGLYGKKVLIILVDSGRTNSFIATEIAKQLGCVIQEDAPMRVVVSNRGYLMSYHSCPQFKWKTRGIEFEHKLRLLDIGGVMWSFGWIG